MDTDLFMALNQVLDSPDRPDHLIIEASGIADPVAIAQALRGEPELGYAGIVTLVDGQNIDALLDDPLVAPQVTQQITGADLVLLTKTTELDTGLAVQLQSIGARPPMLAGAAPLSDLLFDLVPLPRGATPAAHPAYAAWQHDSDRVLDRRALGEKLENRPAGLYRLKGFVLTGDGAYEIHCVGRFLEARRTRADRTTLVGLGPADRISPDEIEAWWAA